MSSRRMTLACLHEGLPPVHYLIGFAGCDVRCTEYALVWIPGAGPAGLRGDEETILELKLQELTLNYYYHL